MNSGGSGPIVLDFMVWALKFLYQEVNWQANIDEEGGGEGKSHGIADAETRGGEVKVGMCPGGGVGPKALIESKGRREMIKVFNINTGNSDGQPETILRPS